VRNVIEPIFEQEFDPCSYGFRPNLGCQNALEEIERLLAAGYVHVVDVDVRKYFASIPHVKLRELLARRVTDGVVRRLIDKWLSAGVLEAGQIHYPEEGTPEGGVISPLLANIYLHYVLDLWFEREVQPRLRGQAVLVRYADDFVICFEHQDDAARVLEVLPKRITRYGLTLHPDKTRLMDFRRPPKDQTRGKGPGSFDFLGFTVLWRRSSTGKWTVAFNTRRERLARAIRLVADWCRGHLHLSVKQQHVALVRRIQGHMNYFGVTGNIRSIQRLVFHARRVWRKWLGRRSQRGWIRWDRFIEIEKRCPLPRPRIMVPLLTSR
jgi:group II intron reverse transcriptase/maturase